jgi:hypothetical protein
MPRFNLRPFLMAGAIAVAATAIAAAPAALYAQDQPRPDDHPVDHPDDHHNNPQPPARHDDHPNDAVAGYRRDHPGTYARCHDGFFTHTSDRRRACTKHGGIDIWIGM